LEETEEMMNNQKAPSADHKVLKAQMQSYDVILKHIDEKQASIDGFVAMVEKVAKDEQQRRDMHDKADEIMTR
jgi:hypothetical protein